MSTTERINPNTLDEFTRSYLECALWSSIDEQPDGNGGPPLDQEYCAHDISQDTLREMVDDCADFQKSNVALLDCAYELGGYEEGRAGFDFWLTRNGHGAGFWDRGLGETGDKLTEACKMYGDVTLYACDDEVHCM